MPDGRTIDRHAVVGRNGAASAGTEAPSRRYRAVLFDLDGTLLPMEIETYVIAYIKSIGRYMLGFDLDPVCFSKATYAGFEAMMDSEDGAQTNRERFWEKFFEVYPRVAPARSPKVDVEARSLEYYETRFDEVREGITFPHPSVPAIIGTLKNKGYTVAVATNPLFPHAATCRRVRWAGLDPEDFAFVTTYEDHSYAKPMLGYYDEVFSRLGIPPEECLMVGNDTREDLAATKRGTGFYLVTPFMINRDHIDISPFQHGTLDDLLAFVEALPDNRCSSSTI